MAFIIFLTAGHYCTGENEYQISPSKTAVKENLVILQNNVKRIIGIIVRPLKDRISVSQKVKGTFTRKIKKK